MTNPTPHGQVPAIQRYKIGYHSDEWGQRSSTPGGIPDHAGSWVRYEDHVTALAAGQATAAPQGVDYPPLPTTYYLAGGGLHPKTANLVQRFAAALAGKLASAEKTYGYSDGWSSQDWMDECRQKLAEHVAKGDPRDVAAYCAFLWHHEASTASTPPAQAAESVLEDAARWQWLADYLIGERTDLDEGIVACATIDALRQFADAARKQGASHD